jgi:outer membrane protein TolC
MKNKTFQTITLLFMILAATTRLFGQEIGNDSINTFSLEKLKEYAVDHNFKILNSDLEIKKSVALKWETTAIGLPQVSGSAEYQNFPDIPVQLFPDFISGAVYGINMGAFGLTPLVPLNEGNKMAVQFGSEHNVNYGISISQLVFSGEYIVGLKASKIFLDLSKKAKDKSIIDVKENVEKTFYLILITEESISVMDSVYQNMTELLNEQQKISEVGFLESTDVEQLKLLVKKTENTLISLRKNKDIFYMLLKLQLGMDNNKELIISGSIEDAVKEIENFGFYPEEINIYDNVDYELVKIQENLADLSYQREKSKFLPSVFAFYSYNQKAMGDTLNFFNKNADWYPTSLWGVKVSVPIFSSGQRYAKLKQAQLNLEQMHNNSLQVEQALSMDAEKAQTEFMLGLNNVKNSSEQRHLAKKIYENSLKKFKAGTEQSYVLTQNQTQYFSALSNYYMALGDLIEKSIKLKKLMNKL